MHTFRMKVFVPSHKNVWLFCNKMIQIKWKQHQQVNHFIMLITLYVSVSFDHHQVCMNKTIQYCNVFDQRVARKQLSKHGTTGNSRGSCVFYAVRAKQQ
jgi:hypothetical protein